MDKPIRFGVVGCTEEAERHLLPIPPKDLIEVTALCDADYKRQQALADKLRPYNGGRGFIIAQTLEATLPDVDAVFIATYHAEQITVALHAGKHVLVEAPIPLDMEQYRFMRESMDYACKHHLYFFVYESCAHANALSSFIKVMHGEIHPYLALQRMVLSARE